jgi:hypothetical protein
MLPRIDWPTTRRKFRFSNTAVYSQPLVVQA